MAISLACGLLAAPAALVDCKDPTQIIVEVHTDDCNVKDTSVTVGADSLDVGARVARNDPPASYSGDGCVSPAEGIIGTLVIAPSGSKSGHVAFEVVTGVDWPSGSCADHKFSGCITATREVDFQPGRTVHYRVEMPRACLGVTCAPGETCLGDGKCYKPSDIHDDGGVAEDASSMDGTVSEGGTPPPPPPPPLDAGTDACSTCKGSSCDGTKNLCTVNCGGPITCAGANNLCSPYMDCEVTCDKPNECQGFDCRTSGTCHVICKGNAGCNGVQCHSGTCNIDCTADSTCANVTTDAGSSTIDCKGNMACNTVTCGGGTCDIICETPPGNSCTNTNCCATTCVGPRGQNCN